MTDQFTTQGMYPFTLPDTQKRQAEQQSQDQTSLFGFEDAPAMGNHTPQYRSTPDSTMGSNFVFGYDLISSYQSPSARSSLTPGPSRYTPQHSQVSVLSGKVSTLDDRRSSSTYEQHGDDLYPNDFAQNLRKRGPEAAFYFPSDYNNTSDSRGSGQNHSPFLDGSGLSGGLCKEQYMDYTEGPWDPQHTVATIPQEYYMAQQEMMLPHTVSYSNTFQGNSAPSTVKDQPLRTLCKENDTYQAYETALGNLEGPSHGTKPMAWVRDVGQDEPWTMFKERYNPYLVNGPCTRVQPYRFGVPPSVDGCVSPGLDHCLQSSPSSEDTIDRPPSENPLGPPPQFSTAEYVANVEIQIDFVADG